MVFGGSSAAPTCTKKSYSGQYLGDHSNLTDVNVALLGGGEHDHHWRGGGQSHTSVAIPPVTSVGVQPVHETSTSTQIAPVTSNQAVETSTQVKHPATSAQGVPVPSQSSSGKPGGDGSPGGGIGIDASSDFQASSFTGLKWYSNWNDIPTSGMGSLEYVPMVHDSGMVDGIKAASAQWSGVTSVLSFNERMSFLPRHIIVLLRLIFVVLQLIRHRQMADRISTQRRHPHCIRTGSPA